MKAVFVFSVAAGVALAVALAWTLRAEVADAAEPPRLESAQDMLTRTIAACKKAGGDWLVGVEDGIYVGRCVNALPNLGTLPVIARRPR